MRVLFASFTQRTHLYPMIPLAWAFRAAGHEVRVAAQPGLTGAIVGAGLSAVEVAAGYDPLAELLKVRDEPGRRPGDIGSLSAGLADLPPEEVRRQRDARFAPLVRLAELMAADLFPFAERWSPQLVVTDPLAFAAPLISATLGIPLVRHIWGPDVTGGHPLQGRATPGDVHRQWPTGLVDLFDRYDVEVRDDYPMHTVDPWPTSLQLPGVPNRLAERAVPYNGSAAGAVPGWILEDPGRPRVCVTWGTTAAMLAGGNTLLPGVVAALGELDVEAVVAAGRADLDRIGDVPDNVRITENLPLSLLLPSCAAIVNQSGPGTVLTAAAYGVPQVLMPATADTPLIAANFGTTGAGVVLDPGQADADAIRSAVTAALTDASIRIAARKVQDEIAATPTPADLVHTLERLA
ncbi:nucleotide disphospho-sugar-binding domain-containing protein [Micromonospora sp. DT53]|uniref:nucleotide disphospho-sugar-binding domain-containing protein n=1 Tax=Micromonospora sp. DT53 TaxID=3393444 RepID=UPI003CE96AD9